MSITHLITILILATLTHTSQSARSSTPPAASPLSLDCTGLANQAVRYCALYINQGSTEPTPTDQCCSELRGWVNNDAYAACLCGFFISPGTGYDDYRVRNLTTACGLPVSSGFAFKTVDVTCLAGENTPDGSSSESGPTAGVLSIPLLLGTATTTLLLSMLS